MDENSHDRDEDDTLAPLDDVMGGLVKLVALVLVFVVVSGVVAAFCWLVSATSGAQFIQVWWPLGFILTAVGLFVFVWSMYSEVPRR